jgi:hypothetical protein
MLEPVETERRVVNVRVNAPERRFTPTSAHAIAPKKMKFPREIRYTACGCGWSRLKGGVGRS